MKKKYSYFYHIIFLSSFLLFTSDIIAQNCDFQNSRTSGCIFVMASDYQPEINEFVTIKVQFTAPFALKKDNYRLGFYLEHGMELISGNNYFKESLNTGELINFEATIKFSEAKVYNINAEFEKEAIMSISIYVGGAFRECRQLQNLRFYYSKLNKIVEQNIIRDKNAPKAYPINKDRITEPNDMPLYNHYDSVHIREAAKWNIKEFNNVKLSIDSLQKKLQYFYNHEKHDINKFRSKDKLNNNDTTGKFINIEEPEENSKGI